VNATSRFPQRFRPLMKEVAKLRLAVKYGADKR